MSTIQFDYDSIKDRLLQRLKSQSEWASFISYGTTDNLISPICQEFAYGMQYSEYLTYENWWSKARNKSSLLVLSPVHGYEVNRKIGATGTLRVSTSEEFNAPYEKNLNIPIAKFFQFSGNGIYVASYKDFTLTANDPYVDIVCKQGEIKTVSFSAKGDVYEEKLIDDGNVDNEFYELYVNGLLWERVDSLFECDGTDQKYELTTKPDLSGVIIKFGNDIYGKKLELNDRVVFKYSATLGTEGNIYSSDIIDKVESQAFDTDGKPVKLYVTNTTAIIGSKDYPTIDEIRTLSPKVYQTGDRASSTDDYETKIKMFTYISKANVWGAYEYLKDHGRDPWEFIPTEENVVHVALLDSSYENLIDFEKNQVIDDLHKKNDPTDIVQFETVEKIPLIFNIKATVQNSSYTLIQVKASLEQTLRDTYGIEHIQFNQNIYNSDFVRLIDEVDGIRNHTSTIEAKKEGYFLKEAYDGEFFLPVYPIDYSNTFFYFMNMDEEEETRAWKKFAHCDEHGSIIGEYYDDVEYNTNGSSLNLTTGVGLLNIVDGFEGMDYTKILIKIIYSGMDADLLLNERYDIFYYDSSNITLSYPQ